MTDTKTKALEEKEKGNAAYKKKDFETALKHYDAAFQLDSTNITILTNKGAVYYEKGELDECIKICEKAVEIGRENHVDFKLIAKALARIGTAYLKKDDLHQALHFYNKSLAEHRVSDIVKKTHEIQALIKEKERLAYINPELSLQEKEKGNAAFKDGKYPEAIQSYTEAIRRNPDDAKLYSNRAACYTKVMEFVLALKDSEECIRLDPKFIKGYLRKGAILSAMKEPTKATNAYLKALELDPNHPEALEGYRKALMAENDDPEAVKQKAMSNPEVQQILKDPAMQMILGQMTKDPKAAREHLKNPEVAAKIQKLMANGIVSVH
ncbi:stress-induced-phosphoprotein 1-like [Plakobranchus ocellatus]|uniref:Stress-induced-phosphoprotein 1 n=1 Tax=Plakobranchus ocellatus TaxID=259542 RepID=A0AAV4C3L3_9GAST|nr:stress-induced-phosphoprotein 1-like [Plakobranchus ocellatus]